MNNHDEGKNIFMYDGTKFVRHYIPPFGTEDEKTKRNTPNFVVENNLMDFSNCIGKLERVRINRKDFKPGLILKTIVDDDITRIKSIVEGTIINIEEDIKHLKTYLQLTNNIVICIWITKYYGIDNIIELNQPMYLDHDSFEKINYEITDVGNYVGVPVQVGWYGNRDYYHLSHGAKRLDV